MGYAQVGALADDPNSWPAVVRVRGFRYDALQEPEGPVPVRQRIDWLGRDPAGYSPQPYEQLAAVYRNAGRDDDARRVAITKQRRRRGELHWPGRLWSSLLDLTVGYGYQTWRAATWLLALVAMGWLIFDQAHPVDLVAAKPPGQRPWFHAGLYALDLLLPFADLGYQSAWIAQGWARWLYLAWNLAGWVLVTAVVAALSGVTKRD